MHTVLFVDNDPQWIVRYQSVFSNSSQWDCFYAEDVLAAVDYLNYLDVDIIVTELQLPLFDGTQILEYVRKRYPRIIRLILTDHEKIEGYLDIVRLAHQFLRKAHSVDRIEEIVQNLYRLHRLVISRHARDMVSSMDSIPALPDAYYRLKAEIDRSEPSLRRVGAIVESDVGLSTTILKLINSSFFAIAEPVTTPSQAVTLLGAEVIKSLVVSSHLFSHFAEKETCDSVAEVMIHSKLVAGFVGEICAYHKVRKSVRETAVMAALLHDLGRLVFESSFHDKYGKAIGISSVTSESLSESERQVLGADHAEVGAYLLGLWGFQYRTVEAVAFHHAPSKCVSADNMLLSILHAADMFALERQERRINFGTEYMDRTYVDETIGLDRWDEWRSVCITYYERVWVPSMDSQGASE
ncbi:response regulator [Chitinivibrio alkaliphilus]|uniref:Signal transduction protein n=1 Tax=Chitinivibrio alkaliphilus ACht1 TaxID=1313304 RepID=U7D8T3_9BACT|nr:response regulator [Chitinivibrio alkaliphilus]ERP31991.1 signal transduction protein [Chitinivibrio alkaliphilus ACht1]